MQIYKWMFLIICMNEGSSEHLTVVEKENNLIPLKIKTLYPQCCFEVLVQNVITGQGIHQFMW